MIELMPVRRRRERSVSMPTSNSRENDADFREQANVIGPQPAQKARPDQNARADLANDGRDFQSGDGFAKDSRRKQDNQQL